MAFSSITALIGGATVDAALVLAVAVEVGTVMTVVGAVTGNKDLMKLGAVVGLVGGIGGFINGAAGTAGAVAADTAQFGTAQAPVTIGGPTSASSIPTPSLGDATFTGINEPSGLTTPNAQSTPATAPTATTPTVPTTQAQPTTTQYDPSFKYDGPQGAVGPQGPKAIADAGAKFATDNAQYAAKGDSFFGNFGKYISDPKNSGIVKTGADLLGGALKGASETDQFNQRMGLENAKFAYQQSQNANVTNGQLASRSGIINTVKA